MTLTFSVIFSSPLSFYSDFFAKFRGRNFLQSEHLVGTSVIGTFCAACSATSCSCLYFVLILIIKLFTLASLQKLVY